MSFNLELTLGRSYIVPEEIQQPVEAAPSSTQPIQQQIEAPLSTQPIQQHAELPLSLAPSSTQPIQQYAELAPSSTHPIQKHAELPLSLAPSSTQPIQQHAELSLSLAPSSTQPIQQYAELAPSSTQPIQQHAELPSSLAPLSLAPSAIQLIEQQVEKPSSAAMIEPRRKKVRRSVKKNEDLTIVPPYPWATDKRCKVYSLQFLKNHGYVSITGNVKCRKCERSYEMSFDLESASQDVLKHFTKELHNQAPDVLMNPILPDCVYCHQKNAVRPEIGDKKKNINWLFLFLGQMLGCCTGEQLKYFCKHNISHRTAAKNRLLFLVYTGICKQLMEVES